MALAEGASSIAISAITHHLLTNLAVLRTFMPVDVEVEGEPDRPGRMRITGSRHD
jgi:RNA 3'-terminal phosphate cyclase